MKVDLTALEHARVLVVGDVMLDRYWHGDTSRISQKRRCPWYAWKMPTTAPVAQPT